MKTKKEPLLTRDAQREEHLAEECAKTIRMHIECVQGGHYTPYESIAAIIQKEVIEELTSSASQTATDAGESLLSRIWNASSVGPWIRTAERPPTSTKERGRIKTQVLALELRPNTELFPVLAWYYRVVKQPLVFPFWMPIPPVPEVQQAATDRDLLEEARDGIGRTLHKWV